MSEPTPGGVAGHEPVDEDEISAVHKLLAFAMTGLIIYVSLTLDLNTYERLGTFLALTLVYLFVRFPLAESFDTEFERSTVRYLRAVDGLLVAATVVSLGYLVANSADVIDRAGSIHGYEIPLGLVAMFLVVEATRRTVGWTIPIFTVAFVAYVYVGPYFPGMFSHPGYSTRQLVMQMYVTSRGLFSFPLAVMFDYVYLFVLFGALLEMSGGAAAFLDLAKLLFGKVTGGPAKLSVFASGSMGVISGSAVANTLTTGAFTIPTMKDQGYDSDFAAGVESAASTGGQLMPPVMGAAIFIMMEITGIEYFTILTRAIVPGLLLFFCIFVAVHFQSVKSGLTGLPDEMIPDRRSVLVRLYYFVPVVLLVWLLYEGFSVRRSIIYSLGLLFVVTAFSRSARLFDPRREGETLRSNPFVHGIELTAKRSAPIVAAATCIGIVLGVIGMTGVGLKVAAVIMDIASTHLLLALIVTMLLSIVFGMAVDTVTVYILLAILVAPGLERIGVPELTAHLFIFYFGMMAMVTPPVCIAAYAAATIAESDPMRSGFWAWKLSLGAFLLPFAFVYDPGLLLIGTTGEIAAAVLTTAVGFVALGAVVVGHMYTNLTYPERGLLFGAALVMVHPSWTLDLLGVALFAAGAFRQVRFLLDGWSLTLTDVR